MIDRDVRDKLSGIVQDYLDEKITAFSFGDQLEKLVSRTSDETVAYAVSMLYYYYDEYKDHKVHLNKEGWDYFQRLLLLLKSEASAHVEEIRIWSWRQIVAGLLLACFLAIAFSFGWGLYLFIVSGPAGLVSIALARSKKSLCPKEWDRLERLTPFTSISQLRDVRQSVTHFKKRPYPTKLADRRVRSTRMERVLHCQQMVLWVLSSPIVLFFQLLPTTVRHVGVKT